MKACRKCKVEKYESEFYKDARAKDGYQGKCIECEKEYKKENKDRIREYKKNYFLGNVDNLYEKRKEWNKKNIEKMREYFNQYKKERIKTDVNFAIKCRLRSRLRMALKGHCKSKSTMQLLGCSVEELKLHLEKGFYNHKTTGEPMTWEKYGEFHIDHIRPCSAFDLSDPEQQKICFHYTNLQPLWAEDNLRKSDSLDWSF